MRKLLDNILFPGSLLLMVFGSVGCSMLFSVLIFQMAAPTDTCRDDCFPRASAVVHDICCCAVEGGWEFAEEQDPAPVRNPQ